MKNLTASLLLFFFAYGAWAQTSIPLPNPSFEANFGININPKGWNNCVYPGESPSDIHSRDTRFFNVNETPFDGDNYLGLVTRENGTWESIFCTLEQPLIGGQVYSLQFHTNMSNTFSSTTAANPDKTVDFKHSTIVQILGGEGGCKAKEILASTAPINGGEWQKQTLLFKPKSTYQQLYIRVYFTDALKPQNGNVLIDNLQEIVLLEDVSQYQEICLEGQLFEVIDKEHFSPKSLKATVLRYHQKLLSLSDPSLSLSPEAKNIQLIDQLQKSIDKRGLKNYIYNENKELVKSHIQALENIGAIEEWEIIGKGVGRYLKIQEQTAGEKDLTYFDDIEERYLEEVQLDKKLANYIEANKEALLNGFGTCN